MSKRGRKPLNGDRQTFNCPASLYDYVLKFGESEGVDGFSASLRHLIADHRKMKEKTSSVIHHPLATRVQ